VTPKVLCLALINPMLVETWLEGVATLRLDGPTPSRYAAARG
jgi:hypothetical protein